MPFSAELVLTLGRATACSPWIYPPETAVKHVVRTFGAVDVELVRWPAEQDRRTHLRLTRRPCLLLVDESAPNPPVTDPWEEWVRLPAVEADIEGRVSGLRRRLAAEPAATRPRLDDDGVVRVGAEWAYLPPIEARLAEELLARFEKIVTRPVLLDAGWPDTEPRRNVLDVHILRLRRRLEPLGLTLRTVRKRGYILGWQHIPGASD